MKIGLFGFGVVGQGLYQLINGTSYDKAIIAKVAVKNKNKSRIIPKEYLVFDANSIIQDKAIDTVVEAIDDTDEAYKIAIATLNAGKNFITANKKLIASHLEELTLLAKKNNVILRYEAAVGGAIPIVENIDNYFGNEPIYGIRGILNGTSNYILTKITKDKLEYKVALKQAQELGFAETDPTADVGGFDPKYKLTILALHAYGVFLKPENILNIGIDRLRPEDFAYAKENGYKIKLVPYLSTIEQEVVGYVLPEFITDKDQLFSVDNEFNGVSIESSYAGAQFFYGRGAGSFPTASAVLSDIEHTLNKRAYKLRKVESPNSVLDDTQVLIEIYVRYTNDAIKRVLNFQSISEGYFSTEYNQVTGFITLQDLKSVAHLLHREKVSVIATGKRKLATVTNQRVLIAS